MLRGRAVDDGAMTKTTAMGGRGTRRWVGASATSYGVLFVLAATTAGGDVPGDNAPASDVIAFYADGGGELRVGAMAMVAAAVAIVFFASGLRVLLRGGDETGRLLAASAMAGGVVFATGLASMASSALALVDAAERGASTDTVAALHLLDSNAYPPAVVGMAVMYLAAGLRILHAPIVPTVIGWAALALATLSVTPAGQVAFYASPIWALALGITAVRRDPDARPVAQTTNDPEGAQP